MGISINVTATSVSLRHLSTNGTRPSERLQSSVVGGHRRVCAMLARASLAAMLLRESYSTEVYYVLLYYVCVYGRGPPSGDLFWELFLLFCVLYKDGKNVCTDLVI